MARGLEASLPTVVDLPDGSFELRPDPRPMRSLKLKLGGIAIFNVAFGAGFLVWSLTMPRIPWWLGALPLAITFPVELVFWFVLRPPVLKADEMERPGRPVENELESGPWGQVLRPGSSLR